MDLIIPLLGVIDMLVRLRERELVACGLNLIPLHGIFRCDAVEVVLVANDCCLGRIIADGQSCPDESTAARLHGIEEADWFAGLPIDMLEPYEMCSGSDRTHWVQQWQMKPRPQWQGEAVRNAYFLDLADGRRSQILSIVAILRTRRAISSYVLQTSPYDLSTPDAEATFDSGAFSLKSRQQSRQVACEGLIDEVRCTP